MAHLLHFEKNPGGKKSSFLVMTYNDKELDEAVKEIYYLCLVVIKGLLSVGKEEASGSFGNSRRFQRIDY